MYASARAPLYSFRVELIFFFSFLDGDSTPLLRGGRVIRVCQQGKGHRGQRRGFRSAQLQVRDGGLWYALQYYCRA